MLPNVIQKEKATVGRCKRIKAKTDWVGWQVLRALDVVLEDDADLEVNSALDLNSSGTVDLSELKTALSRLSFFGIQEGRYFVLLSLVEAESLRGAMHVAKSMGAPLVPGHPNTSVCLRLMPLG